MRKIKELNEKYRTKLKRLILIIAELKHRFIAKNT